MDPNTQAAKNKVTELFEEAKALALDIVEAKAREVMRQHPLEVISFQMGGSQVKFYDQDGHRIDRFDTWLSSCVDFVDEWDSRLKLSSEWMRIEGADGPRLGDE